MIINAVTKEDLERKANGNMLINTNFEQVVGYKGSIIDKSSGSAGNIASRWRYSRSGETTHIYFAGNCMFVKQDNGHIRVYQPVRYENGTYGDVSVSFTYKLASETDGCMAIKLDTGGRNDVILTDFICDGVEHEYKKHIVMTSNSPIKFFEICLGGDVTGKNNVTAGLGISEIKLETGKPSPYIRRSYAEELVLCDYADYMTDYNKPLTSEVKEIRDKIIEMSSDVDKAGKDGHDALDNLGTLRFGVDSKGRAGYIKAGADTVIPFNTVYNLGTGINFDIKKLVPEVDYTKLTVDNFIVGATSINGSGRATASSSSGSWSGSGTGTVKKTYSNGVLSIGGLTCSNSGSNGGAYGNFNATITAECYLVTGGIQKK